jgi:hypothetical protein
VKMANAPHRGAFHFLALQLLRRAGESGLEHSPESIWIGGKGERSNAVSCSDFLNFCLHPKGTEKNRQRASISDDIREAFTVGEITVNYDRLELHSRDSVLDRLLPSQEPRLQTAKLNH